METTLDTEEIKQEVAGFGALQKTSRLDYLLKIKNLKDLLIKEIIYHKNFFFNISYIFLPKILQA